MAQSAWGKAFGAAFGKAFGNLIADIPAPLPQPAVSWRSGGVTIPRRIATVIRQPVDEEAAFLLLL